MDDKKTDNAGTAQETFEEILDILDDAGKQGGIHEIVREDLSRLLIELSTWVEEGDLPTLPIFPLDGPSS